MNKYITLLRGINVGGNKKVPMAALKTLYTELGFEEIQTVLNSGNVIFETERTDIEEIITDIRTAIENLFGFEIEIVLGSVEELKQVLEKNPYSQRDQKKVAIAFLSETSDNIENLKQYAIKEEYKLIGTELYIFYADGQGRSKFTTNAIEKSLGVTATVRGVKTLERILSK